MGLLLRLLWLLLHTATEQRLQQLRGQELQSQGPRLEQEQLQQQVFKRQQIKSLINNQNLGNAGGLFFARGRGLF